MVQTLVQQLGLGRSYPTQRQFIEHGLSGVETAIAQKLGGHRSIAAELGLAMPTPEWTRSTAEIAVRVLVETLGLNRYPTPKEFAETNYSGLFSVISHRFGGHKAFARELALASPRSEWTSDTVDAAIRAVVVAAGSGRRYPTEREMSLHGGPGLSNAARRFGGNPLRAARLGLRKSRQLWDVSSASAAVLEIVEGLALDEYPTQAQFRQVRRQGLYDAIAEQFGGHHAMAHRLRLARTGRHRGPRA